MKFEPTLNISWQEIEEKIFLVDEINDRVHCLEGVSYVIWNAIVVGKDEEQILQHILNIYEKSLESIWNSKLAKRIRELKIKDLKECNSCEKYSHCNCCPGIAFMETEDFLSCSPICKKIAKCRGIK